MLFAECMRSMRCSMLVAAILVACSQPTPQDAAIARTAAQDRAHEVPDSIADLIQARVAPAVAGDSGWTYQQQAMADIDGDGADETVVLISDAALNPSGQPLWEDGHRWQLYVREADGRTTRLYGRFLPNGKLTAHLANPASGAILGIVLLEQTPHHIGVYEFRYRGPDDVDVYRRLDRDLDPGNAFTGSPRP